MSPEGIGLNTTLYKKTLQTTHDLVVYDVATDTIYKLADPGLATRHVFKETRGGKELVITPLDAYTEITDAEIRRELDQLEQHRPDLFR